MTRKQLVPCGQSPTFLEVAHEPRGPCHCCGNWQAYHNDTATVETEAVWA